MVKAKKRSYRQESDEDDDSDSDYVPDPEEGNPKKYSLRKRTKQTFVDDFDYNVDSDVSSPRHITDDEDFEVGNNANELEPCVQYKPPAVSEQGTSQDQLDNGLIDFEDMIRADIVINRNRIDYDNVIGSNEIKVDTKRRGRPPKTKQIEEFTHSILGPFVDALVPAFEPDSPTNTINNPTVSCTELDNGLESHGAKNHHLENTKCASQMKKSCKGNSLEGTTSVEEVRPSTNKKQHSVNGEGIHNGQPINNGSSKGDKEVTGFCTQPQKSEVEDLKPSTQAVDNLESNDTDDVILIENAPDVIVLDD